MRARAASGLIALAVLTAVAAPAQAGVRVTQVGPNFSQPLYVAAPPGDSERRLMVVEKGGTIRVLRDGVASLFLDARPVGTGGEEGLLSMAFAPDYATSGRFYVYYVSADGNALRVDEFTRTSADVADPASRRQVISIPHTTAANHNGATIVFGPHDGHLYIGTGDGGNTPAAAQDPRSLLGKMLRIAPTPGGGYTIPLDNPFRGSTTTAQEILSFGLRNPFRFDIDSYAGFGFLVVGDVGESSKEEVSIALPQSGPPGNFGWPACEGRTCNSPAPANHIPPGIEYPNRPAGPDSVTGGLIVHAGGPPELKDCYLYADFYEGVLRRANIVATGFAPPLTGHGPAIGPTVPNVAAFNRDNAGQIYVTSLNGQVYRLESDAGPSACGFSPPSEPPAADAAPPPASPALPTPPPAVPGSDSRRPVVTVASGGRIDSDGDVIVRLRSDEDVRLTVNGTVSTRGAARAYRLKRVVRGLFARRTTRLVLRPARGARKAIRRARKRSASLNLRAVDRAGNATTRRVRLP